MRPLSTSESARLIQSSTTPDLSSLASLSSRSPSKPALLSTTTNVNSKSYGGGIRRIIDVVDKRALVFDAKVRGASVGSGGAQAAATERMMGNLESAAAKGAGGKARWVPGTKQAKDTSYTFDRVFDGEASNQSVFEETTRPLVGEVLGGINCTVFAYGVSLLLSLTEIAQY